MTTPTNLDDTLYEYITYAEKIAWSIPEAVREDWYESTPLGTQYDTTVFKYLRKAIIDFHPWGFMEYRKQREEVLELIRWEHANYVLYKADDPEGFWPSFPPYFQEDN